MRSVAAADFALDLQESVPAVAVELQGRRSPLQRRDEIARGARRAAASGSGRGRHAAITLPDRERGTDRLPWRMLAGDDAMPDAMSAMPSSPPPTTSVRPRPRPELPPRRRTAPIPRRVGAGVAVLAAIVIVAAAAGWLATRPAPVADRQVAAVVRPSASPAVPTGQPASAPTIDAEPEVATPALDDGLWAQVLRSLDAVRARAYARRNPALLRAVYASAALRRQDERTLDRLVPPGCALTGVRTRYADVHAKRVDDGILVAARAALQPSTLRCGGRARGVAPATTAVALRILLVRTRAGPRIQREWWVR